MLARNNEEDRVMAEATSRMHWNRCRFVDDHQVTAAVDYSDRDRRNWRLVAVDRVVNLIAALEDMTGRHDLVVYTDST